MMPPTLPCRHPTVIALQSSSLHPTVIFTASHFPRHTHTLQGPVFWGGTRQAQLTRARLGKCKCPQQTHAHISSQHREAKAPGGWEGKKS